MKRIQFAATAALAVISVTNVAAAKECKTDVVTASGEPFAARSIGAYPSSLFAWRKAAEAKAGSGYQSWTVAEDKRVDCEQVDVSGKKRWVCTRSARPCKGLIGTAEKKPEFTRTLRRGDSGEDVKAMQFLLNDLGYELELDGNYGQLTQDAVLDFQTKNGLKGDGNFGPDTAEKLLAKS
ncbi:MAG: peptidoglycan-binding protein [Hyphomicrobiaceae bacterium]|nr:peptidoglycan-binding protein [Hyphomicrobiaceae bacterium]